MQTQSYYVRIFCLSQIMSIAQDGSVGFYPADNLQGIYIDISGWSVLPIVINTVIGYLI